MTEAPAATRAMPDAEQDATEAEGAPARGVQAATLVMVTAVEAVVRSVRRDGATPYPRVVTNRAAHVDSARI